MALRVANHLFLGALITMPWVGVGCFQLLLGRSVGVGVQPVYLLGLVAMGLVAQRFLRAAFAPDGPFLLAGLALLITAVGTLQLWWPAHLGLLGEVPWAKSIKQLLLLSYLVALAGLPVVLWRSTDDPRSLLLQWETATSAGLLVVGAYGVAQAAHFYGDVPGFSWLDRLATSNPSIAAGSEELYLGHRFVGIPRVRGPACEPLYFGSYLLSVLPFTVMRLSMLRGRSRAWRLLAAGLGGLCVVLTFSRGVFLAAGVFAMAAMFLSWRRRLPRPSATAAVWLTAATVSGMVGVAALTGRPPWSLPQLLWERMAQSLLEHDMSNQTRWFSWRAALSLWREHPVLGIGWGGFGFRFFDVAPPAASGAHFGWPVTNNIPLRILVETGLVGVMVWAAAAWPSVRALFRPAKPGVSPVGDTVPLVLALAVAVAGLQSGTHSQLQLPHLWLLIGISSAFASTRFRPV